MEIAQIKTRLSMGRVLEHYGLKPDKNNRLSCPFHADKTPSMQVYPKTNTAYCFSANCTTHGKALDVIDFVMYKEGLNKHEALKKTTELCNQIDPIRLFAPEEIKPQMHPLAKTAILTKVFTYFKNAIPNSPPAKEYLKRRGLDALKVEVGYNTGQFHHNGRSKATGSEKDKTLIDSCVQVGLLTDTGSKSKTGDKAYNVFGKLGICFPLKNKDNQITGLYFRSTLDNRDEKHFYLKDSTGLYPHYPKPNTEIIILTEAIIDAATLLQIPEIQEKYGILSLYGVNRFTEEHKAAIQELKQLKEVVFAFDNDEAGNKATAKYSKELQQLFPNIQLSRLVLEENEDINSTALGHEEDIFSHLLATRKAIEIEHIETTQIEIPQSSNLLFSNEKEKERPLTSLNTEVLVSGLHSENPYKLIYKAVTAIYTVMGGLPKTLDNMKVTLSAEGIGQAPLSEGEGLGVRLKSRTKPDLYEDKQVEKTATDIAEKLHLNKTTVEQDLNKLTDLLDQYRENRQNNEQKETYLTEKATRPLTAQERQQAEDFLKRPKLISRLNELLGKTGIVGEEQNRVFLLLIATSHKMNETLHALIQGSSGSGKTRLLKQISDCMPQESVTRLTRVSDKVLYNYPEHYFTNRLLCLEDLDGLSEEAEFAFRELQSNGELNSATSIKLENGTITSGQKTVRGPIASLSCTTRGEIYEDNLSRCFLIAVDESGEQTQRIITYQNQRAAGQHNPVEEQQAKQQIQNMIRLIEPKEVVNPYANKIYLPKEAHKIRRLNDLFQSFIKMVTLVNQYQRKRDAQGRMVAEKEDIYTAIDILFESIVLKVDELDGSLRQFYEHLKAYIKKQHKGEAEKASFSQRDIRQALHLSKAQVNRYLGSLQQLEYLRQSGGHVNRGYQYTIQWWDDHKTLRERIRKELETQLNELP